MKQWFASLVSLCTVLTAVAADVPAASAEFRAQVAADYMPVCVKSIEADPSLKPMYSHKTVETYCSCRQRFRADVLAQAQKNNERGKAVADKAADYSQEKCMHILLQHLEHE